jgi:hypothetical protein
MLRYNIDVRKHDGSWQPLSFRKIVYSLDRAFGGIRPPKMTEMLDHIDDVLCDICSSTESAANSYISRRSLLSIIKSHRDLPTANYSKCDRGASKFVSACAIGNCVAASLAEFGFHAVSANYFFFKGCLSGNDMRALRIHIGKCTHIFGNTAEVGVYRGHVSAAIVSTRDRGALHSESSHYCYDTFCGIVGASVDDGHAIGEFSAALEEVKTRVACHTARFRVGRFPSTFTEADKMFAFVYSDTATYDGARASLEKFIPVMAVGGTFVLYIGPKCDGAKRAVSEYFGETVELRENSARLSEIMSSINSPREPSRVLVKIKEKLFMVHINAPFVIWTRE